MHFQMKDLKHRAYLIFLFRLFCLAPEMASAYTYQDVQDALNSTQSGCVNWAEEVSEKRTSFLKNSQ